MTLELYHASGSLCSQKVKLVLAEKKIEWTSHLLNLLTFENLQPKYIRLNSNGVVPTLIHYGQVITDSAKIICYLEQQFPYPKLSPVDSTLQAQMNRWMALQNQFPMREIMYGNYQGIEGFVLRRSVHIKEKLIPQLIQAHPELKEQYIAKLSDVKKWNSTIKNAKAIASINATIAPTLDQLEAHLTQTDWLCGTTYSLADTVWTAVLNRLDELKFGDLWAGNTRPALNSYFHKLKLRPSFKTAIQDDQMPFPMLLAGLRKVFLGI